MKNKHNERKWEPLESFTTSVKQEERSLEKCESCLTNIVTAKQKNMGKEEEEGLLRKQREPKGKTVILPVPKNETRSSE